MTKLLVVFGATGNQGWSVISAVLNDPTLFSQYRIRGITRDASQPAAKSLQGTGKVEIVQADADDATTLLAALAGAHTVYSITTTINDEMLERRELSQGKAIADAAVVAGAELIIYNTLFDIAQVSGGKYDRGGHFDCKQEVEEYIRGLPIKSAFFAPGGFMQNFKTGMKPRQAGDGTYVLANIVRPDTMILLIDVTDTGKWVAPMLLNPEKYEGQVVAASVKVYTLQEVVNIIGKAERKTAVYRQLPEDVFRGFVPRTEWTTWSI
jgi:uncharacterized protein YbjT (DUF2867 family)